MGEPPLSRRDASHQQAGASPLPGRTRRAREMTEKTFLINYDWRGRVLSCRLRAGEWDQAEEKLDALRSTGRVVGELLMEGDAGPMMTDRIGTC